MTIFLVVLYFTIAGGVAVVLFFSLLFDPFTIKTFDNETLEFLCNVLVALLCGLFWPALLVLRGLGLPR